MSTNAFAAEEISENIISKKFPPIEQNKTYNLFILALTNNFPGNCGSNFFDCGNSYCIDNKMFRDGRIDCTTGIDEGDSLGTAL